MFKGASKFICGIRQGKGISLKSQQLKEDWLNGIKVLTVRKKRKKRKKRKNNVNTNPIEKMPEKKPIFAPKIVTIKKEERAVRAVFFLTKLKGFVEHLQSESLIIDKASKRVARRTVDSLINKLINFKHDNETRKIITEAKHAVNKYCKRPCTAK